MPAASYKGETETVECPHCGDEQVLPCQAFRDMQTDAPTECTNCPAVVDWETQTVVAVNE